MKEERGRKLFVIFFALLVFIFLLTGVNAEKMWNFNNYTLNVSNDLYVGGNIYGNIAGLNSYWNVSGSNLYPADFANLVGINTTTPQDSLNILGTFNVTNTTGVLGLYQDSLGRVGIGGAPTSSYKLQVTGTGYFSSTLTTAGDMYVAGGDIYDASGDLHVLGDDNLYLKTDYNNDDADIRAIIFAKNTGVATVPTAANTLMIINETGLVGINTTTPQNTLNVVGDLNVTGTIYGATFDGVSSLWNESGSYIYPYNLSKNVGIGTASPGAKLEISQAGSVGDVALSVYDQALGSEEFAIKKVSSSGYRILGRGFNTISAADSYGFQLLASDNSAQFLASKGLFLGTSYGTPTIEGGEIETGSGVNLKFSPAGSTSMTLLTGGNVGIGTTTPGYLLHAQTTGTTDAAMYFDGGTGANARIVASAGTDDKLPTLSLWDNSAGAYSVASSFYIALDRGSSSLFASQNDALFVQNYYNKDMHFITNNAGSKGIRMTLDSTGNLGINTTTPQNTLNVVGDLNVTGTIYGSVSGSDLWSVNGNFIYPSNVSKRIVLGATGAANAGLLEINSAAEGATNGISFYNGSGTSLRMYRSNDIGYITRGGSDTTGISVDASGNVGVGIADATYKLDVYQGNLGVHGTTSNVYFGSDGITLNFERNTANYIWAKTAGGYLAFGTNGRGTGLTTSNLVLKNDLTSYFNSSVGIGKNTPAQALDVNGNMQGYNLYLGDSLGNSYIYTPGGNAMEYEDTSGTFRFADSNIVVSSAMVGIGTSSPNRKLEIWGTSSPLLRLNNTGSNQGIEMITAPTRRSWLLGAQYNIDNGFEITPSTTDGGTTFSTPAFVVKSDGNVGIGTSTPQNKLNVVGDLNVTGAIYGGTINTNLLSKVTDYSFSASTNPRDFQSGLQIGFVSSSQGYSNYGTILRGHTYANDGASFEMYYPYSATYGGNSIKYRLGLYDNAGWTSWRTLWDDNNDGSGSGLDADTLDGMDTSSAGNRWGVIPSVGTDGVIEVGKYIDFHETDADVSDYGARLTSTSGTLYTSGNLVVGGTISGSSLDASTLDGIDSTGFGRAYSSGYSFGGTNSDNTTAQFVAVLTSLGAFNYPYWTARGSWCYACNMVITDTGVGDIHLAGAVVEVMGSSSAYTIRITTPTTSTDGVTHSEFIYINNGAGYSPGWRKVWNSANDGSGTGLDADLFDGRNSDDFIDDDGDTMYGILTFGSGAYINMNRQASGSTGIQWYDPSFNAWTEYMAPTGSGQGPKGNLVAPSGSIVTSWAQRSFIENNAGYGWTFESGTSSSTTPTVVAEIRASDGSAWFDGDVTGSQISVDNEGSYLDSKSGYGLELHSSGDDMYLISGNTIPQMNINADSPTAGTVPTAYYWYAGTTSTYADHTMGDLISKDNIELDYKIEFNEPTGSVGAGAPTEYDLQLVAYKSTMTNYYYCSWTGSSCQGIGSTSYPSPSCTSASYENERQIAYQQWHYGILPTCSGLDEFECETYPSYESSTKTYCEGWKYVAGS